MPQSNEYMLKQDDAELIYQKKLTAGTNITIDPVTNTISSTGGGGGGSTVSVIPIVTTGTKIATIVVDAIERDLYAPGADVRVTPTVSTGVQIATITIDGTDYYLYAPESSGGSQVYFGTTDPSDAIGNDKDFYYKLTNLRNTYPVYTHLKMVINANRDDDNYTQLSEINIIDTSSNIFDWSGTTVSCSAETGAGDGPENLIDGLTSTKACAETTPTAAAPIEFTFTLGTPINTEDYQSWRWYTADADSERDPISFDFYGSEDGEVWELLTSATAQEITITREALAYTENFALSVGEISILNRYIKIDDTWVVESGDGGNVADVYVNGTSVLDANDIAQVFSHQEITEQEYEALPSTKESDNIMYCIKGSRPSTNGNYFTPIIYSTEEREVGVWLDNKPLYKKSYILQSLIVINNNGTNINSYIDNVATIEQITNAEACNSLANLQTSNIFVGKSNNNLTAYCAEAGGFNIITLWYTKTTDVAGSGSYTTLGIPAVHYDGEERIIGTWFGETLYEKIINFDYNNIQSRTSSGCEIYINVPNIKDTKDSVILFEGGIIQFPYFVSTSIFIGGFTQTETDTLHISLRYSSSVYNELNDYLTDCRVKLQYTKTS